MSYSKQDIEQFIVSPLYREFLARLEEYIDETNHELDDFHLQHNGRAYDMFRGAKKVLLEMQDFFPNLLIEKEADIELEKNKGEENA